MNKLADYLDAYRPEPLRGFGTVPFQVTQPLVLPGGPLYITPAPAQSSADRDAVDTAMWTLDQQWVRSGTWASMKACVRQIAPYGPTVATPWAELGPEGCRNAVNAPVSPTCNWGFWRIDRCDVATIPTTFQIGRYLWAQGRMREMLASKPVQGVTSAADAAAWTWKSAQLISAFLWSTNVRFDDPNATTGYGGEDLAALIYAPPSASNAGFAYDGPAISRAPYYIPYTLTPRALNIVGDTPIAPLDQNDFAPGTGPLAFMDRNATQVHPMFALATPSGPQPYYSQVPIGITDAQADEIRAMANRTTSAIGGTSARWASTKAFNDWWFRATWSWSSMWIPLGDFYTRTVHVSSGPDASATTYGWSSAPATLVLGGARMAVERLAQQMAFYTSKTNYVAWMQAAVIRYNNQTSGVPSTTPEGAAFNTAKTNLLFNIAQASSQYASQSLSGTAGGDPSGAAYLGLSVSLVQTVFSLVAQSVPLLGTIYSLLQQATSALVAAIGGAVGNTPCPAFPFIRVMSPSSGSCDITTDQISSTLLGISSNASWPVSIAGQSRTFVVDGRTFTASFAATDTTQDAVARRINAAAALVGLGAVASVAGGQVLVQGRDPSLGPAKATGGTACSLGFPGACSAPVVMVLSPGQTANTSTGPAPAKSSSLPWLAAAALLARYLLR